MTTLMAALQEKSATDRWQAIQQLNDTNPSAIDATQQLLLVKALADDHPFVRWQAGLALVNHKEGCRLLVEIVQNTGATPYTNVARAAAADALKLSHSPDTAPSLLQALRSDDAQLRQSAVEALAAQKNPEFVPHLLQAAKDSNLWVRRAAIYALGHLGKPEVISTLIFGLQDPSTLVRRSAAYALGALKAKTAIPQLKLALSAADPLIRRNAAWALGRIGAHEAIPELSRLCTDPALNGTVAATAQQALDIITKPRWLLTLTGQSRQVLKPEIL